MENTNKEYLNISHGEAETTQKPEGSFFSQDGVKVCKEKLTSKQVIDSLLRAKAWKQVDLADKIGLSRQALNNYICNRWAIPSQIKIKIAEALEVDSSAIWDLK